MTPPPTPTPTSLRCGDLVGERWPGPGPTVVLLHAGVADRRSWRTVAPVLAERFVVVAYDRRGYGETPPPHDGSPTPLADLVALLDEHVDGPVHLVGNSMGGALALDLAVTAPERVRSVVAVGTAVSGSVPWEDLATDEATARAEQLLVAARGDLEERLRLTTWLWLDGPSVPEGRVTGTVRALALDMCRTTLLADVPEEREDSGVDGWAALPKLQVPVTYAVGELDLAEQRDLNDRAAARTPGSRSLVLPGTAHLPSLDAPDALLALLQDALHD